MDKSPINFRLIMRSVLVVVSAAKLFGLPYKFNVVLNGETYSVFVLHRESRGIGGEPEHSGLPGWAYADPLRVN